MASARTATAGRCRLACSCDSRARALLGRTSCRDAATRHGERFVDASVDRRNEITEWPDRSDEIGREVLDERFLEPARRLEREQRCRRARVAIDDHELGRYALELARQPREQLCLLGRVVVLHLQAAQVRYCVLVERAIEDLGEKRQRIIAGRELAPVVGRRQVLERLVDDRGHLLRDNRQRTRNHALDLLIERSGDMRIERVGMQRRHPRSHHLAPALGGFVER